MYKRVLRQTICTDQKCILIAQFRGIYSIQPCNRVIYRTPYTTNFFTSTILFLLPKIIRLPTKQILVILTIVVQWNVTFFLRIQETKLTSIRHFDRVFARTVFNVVALVEQLLSIFSLWIIYLLRVLFKTSIDNFFPLSAAPLRLCKHVKLIRFLF